MLINLENIKYYFLTYNNETRKQHMLTEFKEYNITAVDSIHEDSKYKSGAIGFSKILDLASSIQDNNKPFQPFVMFEDDVKKYRSFPKTIEIPDDADLFFIGLSRCGMQHDVWCNTVCYSNVKVNENIIKLHNMLSLHGIIICSARGLLAIQKCMFESYFKDIIWDIFTAQIQPFYNVYALRIPLVYQYGLIGGQEEPTKIEYTLINKNMEDSWINNSHLSVKSCY